MKIGSLCSGYGGLDLAVEALTGAETLWHSEFDKHANKVYESHWSNPNLGDLTQIDWETVPKVDILTGGYPCQPFSNAGNRKGTNDKRHIFPYIAKAIRTLRPRFVFLENVRGHLTLGFDSVLQTLAESGYDAKWSLVRASDIGAAHRRERLFIIAEPSNAYNDGWGNLDSEEHQGESQFEPIGLGNAFANANFINGSTSVRNEIRKQSAIDTSSLGKYREAVERWERVTRPAPPPVIDNRLSPKFVEWMMGLPEGWVTETGVSVSQQFKILGNGVVPQQAYYAYKTLLGVE
jgi:DNA (cytosine-5)-methyltransferase 1